MYKLTCCNPRKISVISSLVTKPTFCIALTYASLPFYKKHSLIILNKYTLYNYMSQINQIQLTILNRPFNRVMVHTKFWGKRSRTFQGLLFPILWHRMTRSKDLSNSYVEGGLLSIAIPSPRKARFLGYFKKRKMNYARNIEIIRKHTFMITKKICLLLCFQCFLCARHSFLTKVIFIQRTLKNIQGLPWEIKRTFQGYPTIFQFSRAREKHYPLF